MCYSVIVILTYFDVHRVLPTTNTKLTKQKQRTLMITNYMVCDNTIVDV